MQSDAEISLLLKASQTHLSLPLQITILTLTQICTFQQLLPLLPLLTVHFLLPANRLQQHHLNVTVSHNGIDPHPISLAGDLVRVLGGGRCGNLTMHIITQHQLSHMHVWFYSISCFVLIKLVIFVSHFHYCYLLYLRANRPYYSISLLYLPSANK